MQKLYRAAVLYLVLGLGAGLFYREFTRANDFPEGQFTQLGVTHTHLLVLGFIMSLIFLVLEKLFQVSRSGKLFTWFFWVYNVGVLMTSGMMVWHGILTVQGVHGDDRGHRGLGPHRDHGCVGPVHGGARSRAQVC